MQWLWQAMGVIMALIGLMDGSREEAELPGPLISTKAGRFRVHVGFKREAPTELLAAVDAVASKRLEDTDCHDGSPMIGFRARDKP